MEKFVIYLRVSTKKQGDSGLGLDAQRKMCTDLITREGGTCVSEFQDVESGKSRTRPGLWKAIDYCKENGCTLVIAKLDRLARDVEFTFKVMRTGIQIRFVDMPVVNTMILGVFATVAQYERELIASRTKGALDAIRDDIKKNGGHVSKNGNYIKKLGPDKGYDMSAARASSAVTRARLADDWRSSSPLYMVTMNLLRKGVQRGEILRITGDLYAQNPSVYCTRNGKKLSQPLLSVWAKEIS